MGRGVIFQYDKNNNFNLISDPIPIKYLLDEKKVLISIIDTVVKKLHVHIHENFAQHSANGSSRIQGIACCQYYSPVALVDSFKINITIAAIHRLAYIVLDISNAFQNKYVPIHYIVCVGPPPYYLDCFDKYYPSVKCKYSDRSTQCTCQITV